MADESHYENAISLARWQGQTISRSQLLDMGWSPTMIRRQLEANRWQRLHSGVYATFTGDPPIKTLWWAAHLRLGDSSVLYGASALATLRLRPSTTPVQIAIPHQDRSRASLDDVVVYRTRSVREIRTSKGAPPSFSVADSVLDMASELESSDDVMGLVSSMCQRRALDPPRLLIALRNRKKQRWRNLIADAANEYRTGATSPLEIHGKRKVLVAHGLPVGQAQVRHSDENGTVFRDLFLAEYGVIIEFDGRMGHADSSGRFRDLRRDNTASASGFVTLRFGWSDVHERACECAVQVERVLVARGWRGQITSCGAHCRAS